MSGIAAELAATAAEYTRLLRLVVDPRVNPRIAVKAAGDLGELVGRLIGERAVLAQRVAALERRLQQEVDTR